MRVEVISDPGNLIFAAKGVTRKNPGIIRKVEPEVSIHVMRSGAGEQAYHRIEELDHHEAHMACRILVLILISAGFPGVFSVRPGLSLPLVIAPSR